MKNNQSNAYKTDLQFEVVFVWSRELATFIAHVFLFYTYLSHTLLHSD